jgi:hypothetical protein
VTLRERLRGLRVGFEAAFAVVTLGLATPLYAAAHAPLQDLPQHIAAVSVLRRLLFGSSLDAVFEVTLSRTQYLLVYALGVPLSALFGAEGAVRLLAALSLVAIPYALRFALRRTGGDERLAALSWPLLWNPQFFLGFLNLLLGVPLALVAIGLFADPARRSEPRRQVTLGALALATFYAHLIPFGVLGLGVLTTLSPPSGRLRALGAELLSWLRQVVFLAPALLAALLWIVRSPANDATVLAGGVGTAPHAEWPSVPSLARELSNTLLDVPGDRDERLLLAWGLGVLAAVALAAKERPPIEARASRTRWAPLLGAAVFAAAYLLRHRTFLALWGPDVPPEATWSEIGFRAAMLAAVGAFVGSAFDRTSEPVPPASDRPSLAWVPAICAALYVVTPSSYGFIWPIHTRFPLVAALLLPLWMPRRSLGRGGWLLVAALGAASLGFVVDLRARVVQWQASELGDLDEALSHARPGRRLVAILAPQSSAWVPNVPMLHVAAYYQARGGAVATFSFADFPQSPFRYREGPSRPPRLPPRWEWTASLEVADPARSYYDYVLVRRGVSDSPAAEPTRYRLAFSGRDWLLYERTREVIP